MTVNEFVLYVIRAALDFPGETFRDLASSLINAFSLSKLFLPTGVEASKIKTTSVVILCMGNSKKKNRRKRLKL